ncbi:hypothetical protein EDC04DRAFT_2615580, partial [Pisolithus marmoratus]
WRRRKRDEVRKRYGYQKIIKCCKQAKKDGYKWLWIDTCCIDKRSSSELSEAINAMYRWYQNAQPSLSNAILASLSNPMVGPEWFMRGWTLQELIAPRQVEFFNRDWVPIGNKRRLAHALKYITRIPHDVLTDGLVGKRLCVAQIMSWAADRKTTRHIRVDPRMPRTGSVLAEGPSDFRCGGFIRKVEPDEFVDRLIEEYTNNPRGVDVRSDDFQTHWRKLVALGDAAHSEQFRAFTVSNVGIQVFLPVIPLPDSPSHCRATLACTRYDELATVDLVSSGSSFDRVPRVDSTSTTCPEFKILYLTHHQDVNEKRREFTLDDKHTAYHGFTRCGTYPHELRGNAVTLPSLTDGLTVIVYSSNDVRSRFAVGLGYYLGQGWVHVVYDGHSPTPDEDWTGFGSRAYHRMWNARAKHAQSMPKPKYEHARHHDHFTKHAHLPQSIWAARVVWGRMIAAALLGDYGDYSGGILIRSGNILEDMRTIDIDSEDAAYFPVVSRVSGWEWPIRYMRNQGNIAVAHGATPTTYLAPHQPKGISLPANDNIVLLLKAMATRLVGKHLVTTVIQCSDFYTVDHVGNRRDSEDVSALVWDSVDPSTEEGTLTPLYTIASPQVWRRHPAYVRRRERFKSIREHFYALVNTVLSLFSLWVGLCHSRCSQRHITGTGAHRKSVNKWKKDGAIKSFSNLFGLKYLGNYIGKIMFFEKLPTMIQTDSLGKGSVGTAVREEINPMQKRTYVLKLCYLCCAGVAKMFVQSVMRHVGMLTKRIKCTRATRQASNIDYDRQLGTPMVREIKRLQAKLDDTEDEDERRALEEDVTGKARTVSSYYIPTLRMVYSLIDPVVLLVVDYIRREGEMKGLLEVYTTMKPMIDPDPEDDQAHWRRIMHDAGAGTSKYQLLLAARAAEQAKWSGVNRSTAVIENGGTIPSTSSQAPSTPVV